ncbi:MAG: hypothetical protein HUJ61_03995, partial [Bacilli bacterium]|nr:hypothetical protein [Bacilli bacterium]
IAVSIDFIRKLPIQYHTFLVERKRAKDSVLESISLSKQINDFMFEKKEYFEKYDKIKVYYDNGQVQLSQILAAALSGRIGSKLITVKVEDPKDYILFQMADICCTIELVKVKLDNGLFLNTEKAIFNTECQFIKDYYNKLTCKRI